MRLPLRTAGTTSRLTGLLATALLAVLAGCTPEKKIEPVKLAEFSVSPTELTAGETAVFRWKASDADKVTVSLGGEVLAEKTGAVANNGSVALQVSTGGDYTVTVTGAAGEPQSKTVTLSVRNAPTVSAFTAEPSMVAQGAKTTLSWQTGGADSLEVSTAQGVIYREQDEAKRASGSLEVVVTAPTKYFLRARNAELATVKEVEVGVHAAPAITTFTTSPSGSVTEGSAVTLTWAAQNATDVSLTANGTALSLSGKNPAGDSVQHTPTETTVYVFTAMGPGGVVRQEQKLLWYAHPVITNFTITPATAQLGKELPVASWTTRHATELELRDPEGGLVDLTGEQPEAGSVSLLQTQGGSRTYTLVAKGPGGSVSAEFTVTMVTPEPTVLNFSAPTSTITLGGSGTFSWSTQFTERVSITYPDPANPSQLVELLPADAPVNGSYSWKPTVAGSFQVTFTAYGPGGQVTAINSPTVKVQEKLPTVKTFTTDRKGTTPTQPVTLAWTTTEATSVTLQENGAALPPERGVTGPLDVNGSVTFLVPLKAGETTSSYTYTLTAVNARDTATKSVTITVANDAPVISAFASTPASLTRGDQLTLSWTTQHADSITIKQGTRSVLTSSSAATVAGSTKTDTPTTAGMLEYVLTATGKGGEVTQTIAVEVLRPTPQLVSFTVDPTQVAEGRSTTLSWEVTETDTVSISTGGTTLPGADALPATGTFTATPAEPMGSTVTYTLTAWQGSTAVGTYTQSITIAPPPPHATLSASTTTLALGESVTLTWLSNAFTTGVRLVDLASPATEYDLSGKNVAGDSVVVTPARGGTYRFVIEALRDGVPDERSNEVEVSVTAPAPDFSSSVAFVDPILTLGQSAQLTWSASDTESVYVLPFIDTAAEGTEVQAQVTTPGVSAFEDLATSATAQSLAFSGDDTRKALTFPAGFTYTYFGRTYAQALVSANGFLGFDEAYSAHSLNGTLGAQGAPGNIVAPFWDDLKAYAGVSDVLYELKGTAPDRQLVIQWNRMGFYSASAPTSELTFQVVLKEAGDLEFRYLAASSSETRQAANLTGASATIGLASATSTASLQVARNTADVVAPGTRIAFRQRLGGDVGPFSFTPPQVGTVSYVLVASGYPASVSSAPQSLQVVKPARLQTFSVDRSHVGAADPVVLSWTSEDAVEWVLEADGIEVTDFDVPATQVATGTFELHPPASATYTLKAVNAAGDFAQLSQAIEVADPRVSAFTVARKTLMPGEPVELSWATSGATALSVTRTNGGNTETVVSLTDPADRAAISAGTHSDTAAPTGLNQYTLTATNANGLGLFTLTVDVLVTSDVVVDAMAVSPLQATAGDPLTLTWNAVNATSLAIQQTIGGEPATELTPAPLPAESRPGSRTFAAPELPAGPDSATVTYEVVAQGSNGPARLSATVEVFARPVVTRFEALPAASGPNFPFTLTWTTDHATDVQVHILGGGPVSSCSTAADGSCVLSAEATTTYVLTARNQLGYAVSQNLEVAIREPDFVYAQSSHRAHMVGAPPVMLAWQASDADSVYVRPFATSTPSGYQPIESMGTPVNSLTFTSWDDSATTFDLSSVSPPLAIPYAGESFTRVTMSTNGWVGLNGPTTQHSDDRNNVMLPSSEAGKARLFAPFWDDLRGYTTEQGAKAGWTVVGTAPSRRLIIEWANWSIYGNTKSNLNFQVVFDEASEAVEYRYGPTSCATCTATQLSRASGDSATVGYNWDANDGFTHSVDTAGAYVPNSALTFVAGPFPSEHMLEVSPPSTRTYTLFARSGPISAQRKLPISVFKAGDLTVSEVFADPAGTDDGREYIELRNLSENTIPDLRGLVVHVNDGNVTQSFEVAGEAPLSVPFTTSTTSSTIPYALLAQSADTAANGGLPAPTYAYGTGIQLPNGLNGAVTLTLTAGNGTVSEFRYGASLGLPVTEGKSMSLDPGVLSADRARSDEFWCLGKELTATGFGTPKSFNDPCYSFVQSTGTFASLVDNPAAVVLLVKDKVTSPGYQEFDWAFPGGFAVNRSGTTYDYLRVSKQGFLSLGSTAAGLGAVVDADSSNNALPEADLPAFTLFPFWDSMFARSGGTPAPDTRVLGFYDSARNAYVVEWVDLRPSSSDTATSARIQAHVFADGSIEYHYGAMFNPTGASISTTELGYMQARGATIGVQLYDDGGRRSFVQHSSSSEVLTLPAIGSPDSFILRLTRRQ